MSFPSPRAFTDGQAYAEGWIRWVGRLLMRCELGQIVHAGDAVEVTLRFQTRADARELFTQFEALKAMACEDSDAA
jgi:hypothetical protein